MANEEQGHEKKHYKLIVNKEHKEWGNEFITGSEIKVLAGSPPDWIVNEKIPGPGNDPEIGDSQKVDLAKDVPPEGIKRFVTRKPHTSPGQ